nr:hypothetical protein GCM10020092_061240 [Actinoplanes digitatis]
MYAIPQDSGPMMLYYRADLFDKFGLTVPKTWDEFAQTARTVRQKDPKKYLTTFSANDPGWFTGLAQQAGAAWWGINGESWKVSVNDAATKKVADYWGALVNEGVIDGKPMYTPAWNKALNDGTLIAWPSAIWAPGVLEGNAPATKGKWAMAPMPQWAAEREQDRQLGRLVHRRHRRQQEQGRRGEVRDLDEHRPGRHRPAHQGERHLPGRPRRAGQPAAPGAARRSSRSRRTSTPRPRRSRTPRSASPGART